MYYICTDPILIYKNFNARFENTLIECELIDGWLYYWKTFYGCKIFFGGSVIVPKKNNASYIICLDRGLVYNVFLKASTLNVEWCLHERRHLILNIPWILWLGFFIKYSSSLCSLTELQLNILPILFWVAELAAYSCKYPGANGTDFLWCVRRSLQWKHRWTISRVRYCNSFSYK